MRYLPTALKTRRYTIFLTGMIFSWTGRFIQQWTLLWHIRTLSNKPFDLSAVALVQVISILLVSLPAGVVVDLVNRRKIVLATQSVMGLISLMLGVLAFGNQAALWQLYVLIGIQSIAFSFDLPARQSMIPHLVPSKDLPNAFSLDTVAYQLGAFSGPMLSGMLIDRLGIATAYWTSTLAYSLIVVLLFFIGHIPQGTLTAAQKKLDIPAVLNGIVFTFRHPLILSTMLLDFFVTLLTRADTLMPIIARDVLGVGAVAYGWLSAAQSIGASIASIILSFVKEIRRQGILLLIAASMVGVGTIVFGLSKTLLFSILALMIVGASDSISSIIRSTIRQIQTPDHIRGRMMGVNQIFFMGGPKLGEVKSGILGGWLGVPAAITIGGIGCILSIGGIMNRWPQLSKYQGEETKMI